MKGAPARAGVLRLLAKRPRTKPEIANAMGWTWSWVHHNVQLLQQRDLVEELTSQRVQRGKVYGLTPLGRQVARTM